MCIDVLNLPIVFGSSPPYGGIPQCAGGGVANGSPTPLWQNKPGKPILLACRWKKDWNENTTHIHITIQAEKVKIW